MSNFILVLKSIIYGIVQGITEWLPISSTGHMIILDNVLNIKDILGIDFFNLFIVVIQAGSVLAVLNVYFKKLWPFVKDRKTKEERYKNLFYISISIIPAGITGFLFSDTIDRYLYNTLTISITLMFYGILFIFIREKNNRKITFKTAIIIGISQVLALIPGTSRSGICIITGLLCGLSMVDSTEYSFYLSIPIIVLASTYKIYKYLIMYTLSIHQLNFLLIGSITSYLISLFVIKYLLDYIKTHDFKIFGLYRMLLGVFLLICYIRGLL